MKPSSLLFLTLFSTLSFCNESKEEKKELLTLETIKKIEKGDRRDLLINNFLEQNTTTSDDAYESLQYIHSMDTKLFTNFALKYGHDETLAVVQCQKMPTQKLINSYADCIKLGLSYEEASKLSPIELQEVIKKTKSKYPNFAKKLNVLASSIPFTKIITLDSKDFYELYFNLPIDFKENYLNYKLPRKTFFRIFEEKENFEKYLKENITNRNFDITNNSFLELNDESLSFESSFLLGLNAFYLNEQNKAHQFLLNALNKSTKHNLNQTLFWLYKTSKNEAFLKDIDLNEQKDIYTKLALEVLNSVKKDQKEKKATIENSLLKYLENKDTASLSLLKRNIAFDRNIDSYLIYEFIKNEKLDEFVLNLYEKKKIKLSSIFESLK